ncbi:hypothetical protein HZS_4374 [Henneguya salminicola]|nr:hypothetical protein HZS_4374 [Henneguya salminicola]
MCDFEKTSINSYMFLYPSNPLTGCFFFTSANVYGTAFKVGGTQHYTKIMKQRGQSLRCLQLRECYSSVRSIGRTYMPQWFRTIIQKTYELL